MWFNFGGLDGARLNWQKTSAAPGVFPGFGPRFGSNIPRSRQLFVDAGLPDLLSIIYLAEIYGRDGDLWGISSPVRASAVAWAPGDGIDGLAGTSVGCRR